MPNFSAFPLVYEEDGEIGIEVVYDPRAGICPLARKKEPLDPSFIKEVRMAARSLIRDPETFEYLKAVSLELLEIMELQAMLEG